MPVKTPLLLAAAFLLTAAAYAAEPPSLSPSLRDRLDQLALRIPADSLSREELRAAETLPARLFSPGAGTAVDEARRADADRERLLDGRPAAPTPDAAQRVFDRLVAELPANLKPDAFPYRLTVLDRPGGAFTTGGGFVYVTRAEVGARLADADRGAAALAFVLADEIAHAALGHARRAAAWRDAVDGIVGFTPLTAPRQALEDALGAADAPGRLVYTPAETEEADCFALHLCRNAGFDTDAALDPVRSAAAEGPVNDTEDVETTNIAVDGALTRLKHLLMERDGRFDDEARHGLFVYDRTTGRLTRCGPRAVGPGERPIVFAHGLRGTEWAFAAYLSDYAKRPELAGRPLLVFRYPNNESLSRCGEFLVREMRRCVAAPDRAVFVCHSAGGLVFRWYAEVRGGGFDHAVFLATPHAGTRLAGFKGLVDLYRFSIDLADGPDYALADAFAEGHGAIARDLEPDSLFLRRLGREKPFVDRYQIFYGRFFDFWQSLELLYVFGQAKRYALEGVADFVPWAAWQNRLTLRLEEATLPDEITDGDLSVSADSARLPGVTRTTSLPLMHEDFRTDPDVVRRVLDAILER